MGDIGGYVIAIPAEYCRGLIAFRRAKTWGELRRNPSSDFMAELEEHCRIAIEYQEWEWPSDNTPLNFLEVPGTGDGDWPFPLQDMIRLVPDEVIAQFGAIITTRLNGDLLAIDPRNIDDFISAMEGAGFDCIRDDKSVEAAVLG